MAFMVPEEHRVATGPMGSTKDYGNSGVFTFCHGSTIFNCIASDQGGWEHVSVSINFPRCPDWNEMCMVKDLFWGEEDTVVQFHPKKSQYVNTHPRVLHLWRCKAAEYRLPPKEMV
jgi:hypothetical protein